MLCYYMRIATLIIFAALLLFTGSKVNRKHYNDQICTKRKLQTIVLFVFKPQLSVSIVKHYYVSKSVSINLF